jgi:phospholipase/carboxylesterase
VLPRAPDRHVVGWSWFPIPLSGVDRGGVEAGLARSRDRLASLLERLPRERHGMGRPVLTGFSQGGMLSFAVAVARPDLVVRAVPVAGWLPASLRPDRLPGGTRAPIRALHGVDDPLLLVGPTRLLVSQLVRTGFDVSLREYAGVGHSVTPSMRRDLFVELARGIAAARAEAKAAH